MIPNLRVLTLTSIGKTEKENARVTLSGMNIKMTAAIDGEMQGRPVKMTTILFLDGDGVEIALSEFDLMQLEGVVGAYSFGEE